MGDVITLYLGTNSYFHCWFSFWKMQAITTATFGCTLHIELQVWQHILLPTLCIPHSFPHACSLLHSSSLLQNLLIFTIHWEDFLDNAQHVLHLFRLVCHQRPYLDTIMMRSLSCSSHAKGKIETTKWKLTCWWKIGFCLAEGTRCPPCQCTLICNTFTRPKSHNNDHYFWPLQNFTSWINRTDHVHVYMENALVGLRWPKHSCAHVHRFHANCVHIHTKLVYVHTPILILGDTHLWDNAIHYFMINSSHTHLHIKLCTHQHYISHILPGTWFMLYVYD